jgi:NTP pyrophosphatase (non-canonical NTP hydrolase)
MTLVRTSGVGSSTELKRMINMVNEHDIKDMEDYQEKTYGFMLPTAKNTQYLFSGLAGEVGEVCSLYAKSVRDGTEQEEFYFKLEKELGDVLFFVAQIGSYYGMSLQDIASTNIAKLTARKAKGTLQGSGDRE